MPPPPPGFEDVAPGTHKNEEEAAAEAREASGPGGDAVDDLASAIAATDVAGAFKNFPPSSSREMTKLLCYQNP